jgi:hypothetical protein
MASPGYRAGGQTDVLVPTAPVRTPQPKGLSPPRRGSKNWLRPAKALTRGLVEFARPILVPPPPVMTPNLMTSTSSRSPCVRVQYMIQVWTFL